MYHSIQACPFQLTQLAILSTVSSEEEQRISIDLGRLGNTVCLFRSFSLQQGHASFGLKSWAEIHGPRELLAACVMAKSPKESKIKSAENTNT